jgi:hypothetical protein
MGPAVKGWPLTDILKFGDEYLCTRTDVSFWDQSAGEHEFDFQYDSEGTKFGAGIVTADLYVNDLRPRGGCTKPVFPCSRCRSLRHGSLPVQGQGPGRHIVLPTIEEIDLLVLR